MDYLKRLLVGRPLKSSENDDQNLSRFAALAMLSSDALSSVAYGTEQIVVVLVTLSAAAIWYSLPIAFVVLILLASLILSYRQIIHAYPHGGGAYVVSSENLGKNAGLIAGGSLLVDYMLTVAVSVSAGAEAIASAIPALYHHRVLISVIIVLLLMLMNLRGLRESAEVTWFGTRLQLYCGDNGVDHSRISQKLFPEQHRFIPPLKLEQLFQESRWRYCYERSLQVPLH